MAVSKSPSVYAVPVGKLHLGLGSVRRSCAFELSISAEQHEGHGPNPMMHGRDPMAVITAWIRPARTLGLLARPAQNVHGRLRRRWTAILLEGAPATLLQGQSHTRRPLGPIRFGSSPIRLAGRRGRLAEVVQAARSALGSAHGFLQRLSGRFGGLQRISFSRMR